MLYCSRVSEGGRVTAWGASEQTLFSYRFSGRNRVRIDKFSLDSVRAPGPERHSTTLNNEVAIEVIVLQNSFFIGAQKFCGLLARPSCKDMRDLTASR
jgi:hypothetical protein